MTVTTMPAHSASPHSTPALSRTSSSSSHRQSKASSFSLDLSDLPPLITPSPPSNTILITNLNNPTIFTPSTLAHLHDLIIEHSLHGVYAFCPLRSLRRIVVTFPDIQSATTIRSILDGETVITDRVRVYFGEHTPLRSLSDEERHLKAPMAQKQFFISPPPSPPAGWEMRDEDPPNTVVHASDLSSALQKLNAYAKPDQTNPRGSEFDAQPSRSPAAPSRRQRSCSSTIVWSPHEHGQSPTLPCIAIEDTTAMPEEIDDEYDPADGSGGGRIIAHTSRPPVELMS